MQVALIAASCYTAPIYLVNGGGGSCMLLHLYQWILRQPDQVSKTETMARGTRGPICGNQLYIVI